MSLTEKLILAVEKYEVLYNTRLPDYKDASKRRLAWAKISQEINLPDAECQVKWKTLRDTFVRKTSQMRKQPSGSAKENIKPWPFYEQMKFVLPHIQPRQTTSNLEPVVTVHVIHQDDVWETGENNLTDENDQTLDNTIEDLDPVEQLVLQETPTNTDLVTNTPKRRRKEKETVDPLERAVISALSAPQDDVYHFTNFVAHELRKMSPSKKKIKYQEITAVLYK